MKKKIVKEETEQNKVKSTDGKVTSDELIKKIILMQPAQVLSFIAKQSGFKSGKELLLKYSPSLTASILKHGFYKTKDLAKSVKDFAKKNIEDNSKIDFENIEIDTDTLKTVYVFDGDSIVKLEDFIKQYQESMKDVAKEAETAGKKLKDDVAKAKVTVSDETLDNNGLTVAGVINNPDNKNKSGKELTKEINQRVELENEIADSMKTTKEQLKKLDKLNLPKLSEKDIEAAFKNIDSTDDNKVSNDTDDYNKRHTEIQKIEKDLTDALKNKLGKDYQSSLDVKVYPTDVFKKAIEQKIPKIVIDAIKARYTLGVRIDFFGDESDTVIEKEEEPRYVVKLVTKSEKNPGIKKIVETFKSIISSKINKDDIEGKVYTYLKYWKGENPDANFDSLFIFMGFTKFNVKESLSESNMINESADKVNQLTDISKAIMFKLTSELRSMKNMGDIEEYNEKTEEFKKQLLQWLKDAAEKENLSDNEITQLISNNEEIFNNALIKKLPSPGSKMWNIVHDIIDYDNNNEKVTFEKYNPGFLTDLFDKSVDTLANNIEEQKNFINSLNPKQKEQFENYMKCGIIRANNEALTDKIGGHYISNSDNTEYNLFKTLTPEQKEQFDKLNFEHTLKHFVNPTDSETSKLYDELVKMYNIDKDIISNYQELFNDPDLSEDDKLNLLNKIGKSITGIPNLPSYETHGMIDELKDIAHDYGIDRNRVEGKFLDAEPNSLNKLAYTSSSNNGTNVSKVEFWGKDRQNPKIFPPTDAGYDPMTERLDIIGNGQNGTPKGLQYYLNALKNNPNDAKILAKFEAKLEEQKLQIEDWNKWINSLSEEDLKNEKTQFIVASMKNIEEDFNKFSTQATDYMNSDVFKNAESYVEETITNTKDVDKESIAELSNNEETKQVTKGFFGKLGDGLKSFMSVIAIAKIAKFVLNHGKTFTDILGAQVVKFKEDKNIIAEITCILNNADGSESNYSDTKFSIRFDISDMKWHATNLDNRKMKITNEDALIKKIMEVPEVKEFKTKCLETWKKIFDPSQTDNAIIPYFLKNYEKLGMKINDKNMKKYIESLIKVADNFETIKKAFEGK